MVGSPPGWADMSRADVKSAIAGKRLKCRRSSASIRSPTRGERAVTCWANDRWTSATSDTAMSDTAMNNTAMNDLAKIVVFALLFALAVVTGCDGFETTDGNWSADASPHALDVAANGIAMAMGSAVITIASEDSDYRIRAQAMNGEAFSLDLNNVDGSGTYYVAPIDGRTAHGYYI